MHYIYLVRNKVTHEPYYVGQTTGLENRAITHYTNDTYKDPEVICLYETDNKKLADAFEFHYTLLYKTYIPIDRTYNVRIGTFGIVPLYNENNKQYKVVPNLIYKKYRDMEDRFHKKVHEYNKLSRENKKLLRIINKHNIDIK